MKEMIDEVKEQGIFKNLLWLRNNRIFAVLFLILVSLLASLNVQGKEDEGLKTGSPEDFVEKLIQAYQDQDDEKLKVYHGIEIEGTGVEFEELFFASFDADSVKCDGVEILIHKNQYLYMGAKMTFLRGKKTRIPFYEYYLLLEEEPGIYRAVPFGSYPSGITKTIEREQDRWEKTKLYKEYLKEEKIFLKQSPRYAREFYDRFMHFLNGMPKEMRENLQMIGVIFAMAVVELAFILVYSSKKRKCRKLILINSVFKRI